MSAAVDDRVGDFEAFFCADKYFVQVAFAYGGDTLTRIGVGGTGLAALEVEIVLTLVGPEYPASPPTPRATQQGGGRDSRFLQTYCSVNGADRELPGLTRKADVR